MNNLEESNTEKQQRRIQENLVMALQSAKTIENCLSKALQFTTDDGSDQQVIQSLGLFAERLRLKIELAIEHR